MVAFCGTGGWGGPQPGDPDNNSVLTATPAFGGIDISWTYPGVNPHAVAHTLLYRSILPTFEGAMALAVVAGNFFYDKLNNNIRYYYWIKIVSVNGTMGALIGPATAVARPLIADLMEQLTGQIDAGVLAQSLKGTLDQISTLNTNLANEITSRQNSEITLSQAMASVNAGNAQALTFINNESTSRVSADSAQAENLNLVVTTLNGNIAAVSTTSTAGINAVTGVVNAMYTAKVTVNGLVGGFGLTNNGAQVEAGFDVDTFWVGRTSLNKRKPFIIVGNETFIDEAAINKLTFNKLRADDGSVIIENGKLKAAYVKADTLSALSATIGTLRTATVGARMEIADNVIRVYDVNGTLRVKLGNLA